MRLKKKVEYGRRAALSTAGRLSRVFFLLGFKEKYLMRGDNEARCRARSASRQRIGFSSR